MRIQFVFEDGKVNFALGAKSVEEMQQIIHQFMDPIAAQLGYEIQIVKKKDVPQTAASKFKRI